MKKSSNHNMEPTWKILSDISRTEAPGSYDLLMDHIRLSRRRNTIPLVRVRAAAAVLLCVVSVEVYMVLQQAAKKRGRALQELAAVPDNMLYHE